MIVSVRDWFNKEFTVQKYRAYLDYFNQFYSDAIRFRIAETPIFISDDFKEKMLEVSEFVIDAIVDEGFKAMTDNAVPDFIQTKGEGKHPNFLVMDYGICKNTQTGGLEPQLIEMQGFPSLFFYQLYQDLAARKAYEIPHQWQIFLNGYNMEKTIDLLREVILSNENPENVVLLELYPEKQKTQIDFYFTEKHLGIQTVCLTKVKIRNGYLYYEKEGKDIPIKRIYNRVIWDDVAHNSDLFVQNQAKEIMSNTNVRWATHPSWFYRISKFTLPFLSHPNIPASYFLSTFLDPPRDLEQYVLKPLFSFSGHGVKIHPIADDIFQIPDPQNYILQKKVRYAPIIKTPDEPAKAEIRLFYIWPDDAPRPIVTHNLARLTKADMVGVDYNRDKTWIGGSFAYFDNSHD